MITHDEDWIAATLADYGLCMDAQVEEIEGEVMAGLMRTYAERMMQQHAQRMDRLGATTATLLNATLLKELAEKDARIAELTDELAKYKPQPVAVRFWGMRDNHTFVRYTPTSIDNLFEQWLASETDEWGLPALCPVRLLDRDGRDVREVGCMVHHANDAEGIKRYREALEADADVMALLASVMTLLARAYDDPQKGEQA